MAVELRSIQSDQAVQIDVSWDAYKAIVDSRANNSRTRLTFDGETLEIMSPGSKHERIANLIADLVSAVRSEWELNIEDTGSTTFLRSGERGFEADKSYYIKNAVNVRDFDDINLTFDPPPDLVIEVDITNIRYDKADLYSRIGIAEFWRYRVDRLTASTSVNGAFIEVPVSRVIPGLVIAEVQNMLARKGSRLDVLAIWRTWLRTNRSLHEAARNTEL